MQIRRPNARTRQRPDELIEWYEGDYSHIGQILASRENDFERYLYCRQRAEQCRDEWFEKERRHIVVTLRTRNAQFHGMTPRQRVTHAKIRWQTSVEAQEIMSDEQMWTRWAQTYQFAVMMQRLEMLHRLLETERAS